MAVTRLKLRCWWTTFLLLAHLACRKMQFLMFMKTLFSLLIFFADCQLRTGCSQLLKAAAAFGSWQHLPFIFRGQKGYLSLLRASLLLQPEKDNPRLFPYFRVETSMTANITLQVPGLGLDILGEQSFWLCIISVWLGSYKGMLHFIWSPILRLDPPLLEP